MESDAASAALGRRLDALPDAVRDTRRFPLGRYRGLDFGVVLHSGGAADVFLEGAATRHGMLSRDHHGPRAVLNALDRLAGSHQGQCDSTAAELAIAEGQLRDHEARIGRVFPHNDYVRELTDIRDRLKAGLSQAAPEPGIEPVAEVAERIKVLIAAHTIDAAPTRTATRRIVAEEPVTARIRRRAQPKHFVTQPQADPEPASQSDEIPPVKSTPPALTDGTPAPPVVPAAIEMPDAPARPQASYRQRVARGRRQPDRQLSLF